MIIVLRAVFDDSDMQTDYFHRDRTFEEWYICDLEGKRVTQGKLRKALKRLPAWLQQINWTFRKGEVYSMTDHPYGQLRVDQGVDLEIKGEFTYSHYTRALRFVLTATSLGRESVGVSKEKQTIPQSKEQLAQLIEQREHKWREQRQRAKEHMKQVMPKIIQDSHAIIDGKGFRVLTKEEKKKMIEKYIA